MAVVEVPQWQGSSSPTATLLSEGAMMLGALIAEPEGVEITVPLGGTLAETARHVHEALSTAGERFVVTVGGDCGVELAPISAAARRHEGGNGLAVVWFDAHGDLNTPASSPSGAFHGMVLRTLLGEGPPDLVPELPLRPEQVILAGVRALDPAEQDYVDATGITHIAKPDPAALVEAIRRTGATAVYIHIDLDVLDPRTFTSVGVPEPDGFLPDELVDHVVALAERFDVVGLGITEYEPTRPEDHLLLASLLPPLVRQCRNSTPWQIEQRAALAWPATVVERHEGWLLRHTPGTTRKRSNSALPPFHVSTNLEQELHHIQNFYRERDLPLRIQVSPAEAHPQLDGLLAHRGYHLTGKTRVLIAGAADLVNRVAPVFPVVPIDHHARRADVFRSLDQHSDSRLIADKVIAHIPDPMAFLVVVHGDEAVGMVLLAAHTGWTGIFAMATHPDHRRNGVATTLLHAAAQWALAQPAPRLYLQVEEDNGPAYGLYTRSGFTPSHSYHYRVRP
ncbi:GNAT family N-acetyltransferase [Sinosporangium siamense]|uniref:GNAT family N-acetyltransferase n=1 Tax=Sinosporangium siamense TaxID=1367973 RepID=UPI001EF1F9D9|nr:GNAT family N-acetyltransferase [Sinosporangium siamense]